MPGQEIRLACSLPFDPQQDTTRLLESLPSRAGVFALFPSRDDSTPASPFISRTLDLRRRLMRLLAPAQTASRRLNLRHFTRRIDYQCVGSAFEAQWLLYLLNRFHSPQHYLRRLRLRPPALLKLNLRNRFPRCYPTRRLIKDGSVYYGPFPSRAAAERFAAEFLEFFKLRRCYQEIQPDPGSPGCIYSQMHKCLAPCLAACTDEEYQREVRRVTEFLHTGGQSLLRLLKQDRQQACESLDYERASRVHQRLQQVQQSLRWRPDLTCDLHHLHAIIVQPGAEPQSVALFRVDGGRLSGPVSLVLAQNVSSPVPLDEQFNQALACLGSASTAPSAKRAAGPGPASGGDSISFTGCEPPLWEHLSLLTRWYYSSFRQGDLVMLSRSGEVPHARLVRLCRRMIVGSDSAPASLSG